MSNHVLSFVMDNNLMLEKKVRIKLNKKLANYPLFRTEYLLFPWK